MLASRRFGIHHYRETIDIAIALEPDKVVKVHICTRRALLIYLAAIPLRFDRDYIGRRRGRVKHSPQSANARIVGGRTAAMHIVYSRVIERSCRSKRENLI